MSAIKPKLPVIAGLDIGSTKVCFVIGVINSENKLEVVGVGTAPNTGIRQGVVVNIEATTESIKKAKEEAELMSGYQLHDAWVAVSGTHIASFDSKGMVAIKDKEVTASDIDRVIEAAKAVAVPADRTVLHVLPREYRVDGQDGISDPIGMSGVRLESLVHIVTANQAALSNSVKCIERTGLKISGLVLNQLAASMAVLSEDEKNLGVCMVDMGGGTCTAIYFVNGSIAHTSVIPVGGQHFTHDVAVGLRTPQVAAEELKKRYGCALASVVGDSETVDVDGVGGRKKRTIPRRELAEVLEPRAEEVLNMIGNDIRMSGLIPMLGSGIVLTGGASQLEGLIEMGEFIFDVPVRRGIPERMGGLIDVVRSPEYATAVGLLMYGWEQKKDWYLQHKDDLNISESIDGMAKKMRDFFGQIF